MARATSSLPLPFSPLISTRAFVGATRATSSPNLAEPFARADIAKRESWRARARREAAVLASQEAVFQSALHRHERRSESSGFSRKRNAALLDGLHPPS